MCHGLCLVWLFVLESDKVNPVAICYALHLVKIRLPIDNHLLSASHLMHHTLWVGGWVGGCTCRFALQCVHHCSRFLVSLQRMEESVDEVTLRDRERERGGG